jgi:hypothetical protein
MQKPITTAFIAAVVMLGGTEAYGQASVWRTNSNNGMSWTLSNAHYTAAGATSGVSIYFGSQNSQTVENLYSVGGTFGNNFAGLTVDNLYATTDSLAPNERPTHKSLVTNHWLKGVHSSRLR